MDIADRHMCARAGLRHVRRGQTGFHPTNVTCPSGVEAKVGQEFDCHFTGHEGKPYTAHMRITKVDGERVDFDVRSRPT
jgi:hypothetical protein